VPVPSLLGCVTFMWGQGVHKVRSVNAKRFVRKMRGSAQAHLLECDDGSFYVVKFSNNPRAAVGFWIMSLSHPFS